MVKLTEELIRKKSEHNELIIYNLEELSLHQENIERIENVQNYCRELKILLLQSNLIPKIENLHKLKKLEYLNLAINNVEKIENLGGCESLQKLDLTLNFIGELTSVESLRCNIQLEELFLTGNPCTDYPSYRDYVVVTLPQLKYLDGAEITRAERFQAQNRYEQKRHEIVQLQAQYQMSRDEQKLRVQKEIDAMADVELSDDEKLKEFWNMKSENCPEVRNEIAKKARGANRGNKVDMTAERAARDRFVPKLFNDTGRPYCLNLAKLDFTFSDETDRYELDLHVYKYLDTSLIQIDTQINYVRVTIKGKIFQMALNDEIRIDECSAKRSQTTGHLLIVMPKLCAENAVGTSSSWDADNDGKVVKKKMTKRKTEFDESRGAVDIRNIVQNEDDVPPLI